MNPYNEQPPTAFWRQAVADVSPFDIKELWRPKFAIESKNVWSTYGSCFAQHLSQALVRSGYNWKSFENAPAYVNENVRKQFNYGIFSARTGNIYTTSMLLQWLNWAFKLSETSDEVWEKGGRFYDPFRPNIEPNGFKDAEELYRSRDETLKAFRESVLKSRYFVFTLGLTERWTNDATGVEYPMCPGTAAGTFDPDRHKFHNHDFRSASAALTEAIKILKKNNPGIRVLLTVSPVPLTATATDEHVLIATSYSKSTLRSVAEYAKNAFRNVDYFPSYEIISSVPFRSMFFEPNMRSVNLRGVQLVMEHFFGGAIGDSPATAANGPDVKKPAVKSDEDVVCEEALLDAFGG